MGGDLVSLTEWILREVKANFKKPAQLWSTGKDSTLLLWLTRRLFGEVPWPVIHIDTGKHFKEVYEFRDRLADEWNFELLVAKHPEADTIRPEVHGVEICCHKLKTEALKALMKEYGFDSLIVSIRRDEHGIRMKERYISPRDSEWRWKYEDQPVELIGWGLFFRDFEEADHVRVHPLLHWTFMDVWEFTLRNNIPVNPLYLKGYTSIGCRPCTKPTLGREFKSLEEYVAFLKSKRVEERAGRLIDKEKLMQRLRALGYW